METNIRFHDKIAQISLEHFNSLPKSGKPNSEQWTVLSCIVLEQNNCFSVVALGTGSKCIGRSKMSASGDILNDSHAEVVCRRSFLRFLYSQMLEDSSILTFDECLKKFLIKTGTKFHFFTTHVPCGDCTIFPKQCSEEFGNILPEDTIVEEEEERLPLKKAKLEKDIFRTGAKCLVSEKKQDSKLPGKEYHVVGVVRTKPGRGDSTLSVSCSDKISKWCHLGIQGALVSLLLDKPIYFSSFTICGGTPFSDESFNRAIYDRVGKVNLPAPYQSNKMLSGQSTGWHFQFVKSDAKQPCPSSISWCSIKDKNLEVAVEGKKQGVTKKKINTEIGRLKICKYELFKYFMSVCQLKGIDIAISGNVSYANVKKLANEYQKNWKILKDAFGTWTMKDPKLLNFVVGK